MRYRKLARTGYEVSEIGYGAWGIGKQLWIGAEDSESLRALHRAVDQGVNFIDTALAYGDGHSERLVSQILREREERIYVATKVPPKNGGWPARGTLEEAFPAPYIIQCAERSLRNLGVEAIDLLQLHVWDPSWIEDSQWYDALKELQAKGKIIRLGISINDHQPNSALELVQSGKIDTVQVIYNIFDQTCEDQLLSLCLEKDVGVIVRVPFDEGGLTGTITPETKFPKKDWRNFYFKGDRKRQVHDRVQELNELLGGEIPALPNLALRFCLHHKAVSTVIPGMRSVEHVEANVSASDETALSGEMIRNLRKHRWDKNFYL
jgi:aryl-alcohol dehydrogenase-like predicted oxidoreductase